MLPNLKVNIITPFLNLLLTGDYICVQKIGFSPKTNVKRHTVTKGLQLHHLHYKFFKCNVTLRTNVEKISLIISIANHSSRYKTIKDTLKGGSFTYMLRKMIKELQF